MNEPTNRPLIQSISRAAAILRCFESSRELGLTEISRMVELHKSTTAGIIHTLKAERFLDQDPHTGKLRLGSALLLLGNSARLGLEDTCEPYLSALLEQTGETVNLAVADGDEVVYVAKKESPHSMRISTSVGKRMPLYCTAIGKAILANMEHAAAEKLIDGIAFTPFTEKTIADKASLKNALEKVRAEGVAYDFEELEYGLICMAAPIFRRGGEPIGAISVSGPVTRMDNAFRETIKPQLQKTARRISEQLAYAL